MSYQLNLGDCLDILPTLESESIDAIVTDPPYGLSFMGKAWDNAVPSVDVWRECLRVLKPGGHLLCFAGTRTQHRMATAIEDAGFEIRDMIAWVYASGFPKSLDVSKAIDKAAPRIGMFDDFAKHFSESLKASGFTQKEVARYFPSKTGGLTGCVWNWANGANVPTVEQWQALQPMLKLSKEWLPLIERIEAEREVVGKHSTDMGGIGGERLGQAGGDITAPATPEAQQWDGWGTALKPALEPITVARKPLTGTVAANVLQHGTGAINVDGCRVGTNGETPSGSGNGSKGESWNSFSGNGGNLTTQGRFPANLIHDGSDEVTRLFPETGASKAAPPGGTNPNPMDWGNGRTDGGIVKGHDDNGGSAARFFYMAKASKRDRDEGLDKTVLIDIESLTCEENTTSSERLARLLVATEPLPPRVTAEYGTGNKSVIEWSITLFGKALTEQFQTGSKSTTSMGTSSTTESKILNSLTRYITSESIPGVSLETENGGSRAGSAENSNTLTIIISEKTASALGVKSAKNGTRLRISVREGSNIHSTVKPTDLMRYLVRLVTPPGGVVLDPFTGSGSTGKACMYEGFSFIGCELDPEYIEISTARIEYAIHDDGVDDEPGQLTMFDEPPQKWEQLGMFTRDGAT